jgi:hypothetical protein
MKRVLKIAGISLVSRQKIVNGSGPLKQPAWQKVLDEFDPHLIIAKKFDHSF